jgi:HEAT repeat protein
MKALGLCLFVGSLAGCSSSASSEAGMIPARTAPRVQTNQPAKQVEPAEDRAAVLIRKLQSPGDADREQAKEELRSLAKESAESRRRVIDESIRLMKSTDAAQRIPSSAQYDAWRFAAELLGELKATEAVDTLIACIDCNDGIMGLSFHRFPALRALTMIGPEAVPKLTEALSDSRPRTRGYAALALGEIGGVEAKAALERALLTEQDPDVIPSIRIALREQ